MYYYTYVLRCFIIKQFLQINSTAKIYVQKKAFESHYSKFLFLKVSVGLNKEFEKHPQVILIDGDYQIDDELSLFTVKDANKCYSNANDALYTKNSKDDFSHEQNLIIKEQQTAFIMGCGHVGQMRHIRRKRRITGYLYNLTE